MPLLAPDWVAGVESVRDVMADGGRRASSGRVGGHILVKRVLATLDEGFRLGLSSIGNARVSWETRHHECAVVCSAGMWVSRVPFASRVEYIRILVSRGKSRNRNDRHAVLGTWSQAFSLESYLIPPLYIAAFPRILSRGVTWIP